MSVPLCKDCKWSRTVGAVEHMRCANVTALNLARSENPYHLLPAVEKVSLPFCVHMRRNETGYLGFGSCGNDGRLWEQKPICWWQFWKRRA